MFISISWFWWIICSWYSSDVKCSRLLGQMVPDLWVSYPPKYLREGWILYHSRLLQPFCRGIEGLIVQPSEYVEVRSIHRGSVVPIIIFVCITSSTYYSPLSKGAPAGPVEQANGTSVTLDFTQDPGKWAVFFDQFPSYFHFPYWILATGPLAAYPSCFKGVAKCYAWSIVSDPYRSSLFVLARSVEEFNAVYKNVALKFAKDNGFDKFYNKPIETYQQPDCVYAPTP